MTSRATPRFWKAFSELPAEVQDEAREAYRMFGSNPGHPSLRFKKIHTDRPIYSARINLQYRVLGVVERDTVVWFWVGNHDDYDRLLKTL